MDAYVDGMWIFTENIEDLDELSKAYQQYGANVFTDGQYEQIRASKKAPIHALF